MSHHYVSSLRAAAASLLVVVSSATFAASGGYYGIPFEKEPPAAAMTSLGRRLFFDRSLSASSRQSCASCHDPRLAYGPPDGRAVQHGGPTLRRAGVRAVPSLRYLQGVPAFTEHYSESDGNDSEDQGPAGGNNWDGRAPTKHDQARIPLLSPFEMANRDEHEVVDRVARSAYADAMREAFGAHLFEDRPLAFKAIVLALEVFQQSPQDFYPYDSKYDAYLRGRATLTDAERRGLATFDDPARGNCASCHPSAMRAGALPAFTDFGFVALGVPRNRTIPANHDPAYHDLGLCGPYRTDLADRKPYCGRFRTPSLRNAALRTSFFHNGVVHTLEDAIRFYAERDARPRRWYPTVRYDDLPRHFVANVNLEPPFGRRPGGKPALDDGEIRDIAAFLRTLNDGYGARAGARDVTPSARPSSRPAFSR